MSEHVIAVDRLLAAHREPLALAAPAPAPVGEVAALLPRLLAHGLPLALGLDLPLGLLSGFALHLATVWICIIGAATRTPATVLSPVSSYSPA